jgi:ribose transport system permease protein
VEAAAPTAAKRRRRLPDTAVLAGVLVALAIFFSTQSQFYLTPNNLLNILVNAAVIGIIAAPGTLLLVAGQFDLSVGSGAAFIGVIMAWSASQWGIPTAVLLSLAAGLLIGMINGFAVTVLGINALITTLATLAILRGLGQVVAGGQTLLLPGFNELGNARPFFNIPVPVLVFVAVIIVTALLMKFTVFGRSMYAIGANPVAARLAGIRTKTAIFGGFLLSGAAVAVGGLILVSQLGASLAGGRGTIAGTVLGVLILGTLNNGLTLMNIDSFWQDVARGVLLLAAVGFDQLRLRLQADK